MAKRRPAAPPQNDVYVGMFLVSLLALVFACLLLFLDWGQYGFQQRPGL